MGFFSRRPKKLSDDELRDALFDAVAGSSPRHFYELLTSQLERIVALFPTWKILPPAVQSDVSRAKWWCQGAIGVAAAVAELGDRSLMAQLEVPPDQNPVIQWQQSFLAAETDAANGEYSSAISKLEQILEEMEGATGTAIDDLLPKIYGLLGTVNHRAGNREQAHHFTVKAKIYCERTGDHEGAQIYARNLTVIDGI